MSEHPPLTHHNQGRKPATIAALLAAIAVLAFLYSIGTVTWFLMVLALFTVPALIDVLRNPTAEFALDDQYMSWRSSSQTVKLPLTRIAKARFDTRWDFSVRVTLILIDNSKMRIPQDAMPPHQGLEDALKARGFTTERHHFRVV